MAKLLKLRRGTTSQHSSFTGAEGEVTIDTTKDTAVVHDGSTAGGHPLVKENAEVTSTGIASNVVDEDNLKISNSPTNGQFLSAQSGNTGGLTWATPTTYTHPNHSGEVTSSADGAQTIADNVVDEANLKVSNAPTNGQFLSAQSGNTGGLTWADVDLSTYAPLASPALTGTATGVNLTLSGNLTVNGTTTTVATTNTTITDNLLELNSGAGSNANDSGILIERGSTGDNAIIAWDESADRFTLGTTTSTNTATGNISVSTGTLAANIVGNVTGSGANLTSLPAAQVSGTLGSCNASNLTSIPAGQLTGTLPAISGANLTNLPGGGGELSVSTSGTLSVGDRMGFNSSGNAVKIGSVVSINNPPTQKFNVSTSTSSVVPNTFTQCVYMPALGVYVALVLESGNNTGRLKIFKYDAAGFTHHNTNQSVTVFSGKACHLTRMSDTKILMCCTGATASRIKPYIITLTASSDSTGYTITNVDTVSSSSGATEFSISGSTSYYQYWQANDEHLAVSRVSATKVVLAFQGAVGSNGGATNHAVVGVVEFTNANLTQWNAGSCAQASTTGGIGQAVRMCKISSNKWAIAMEGDTRCAVRAFSVSSLSPSFGSRVILDENGNGQDYQNIGYDATADRVLVSWVNSSSQYRRMAVLSHSGNYLTQQGSSHTLMTGSTAYARMSMCPVGNMGGYWFLSIYGGQGGSNDMQLIRVNSSSITEYSEGNGFSSSNPYTGQYDGGDEYTANGIKFDSGTGHIIRVHGYSGNSLYINTFDCGSGTPTSTGYIGCYKSSGKVYVAGGVATGLSGLTPGSAYYVDDVGALSTDSTKQLAGVAKTSTTMLVK